MKTIYKSLITLAVALLLNPAAKAQYHQDATSGFAFDKYVTSKNPDENGEYTLRIETFATGEVTVERKAIPSDIILVLDGSGSMLTKMWHATKRVRMGTTNYNYSSGFGSGNSNSAFWIRYPDTEDGVFYRVYHDAEKLNPESAANDNFWLYFTIPANEEAGTPSQRYYLYGTYNAADPEGCFHTEKPTAYNANNVTIFKGQLYRCPQRNEVLMDAVKGFIDKIAENDSLEVRPYLEPGTVGNQISIVQYEKNSRPESINDPFIGHQDTKAVIDFTAVNTTSSINALKAAVNTLNSTIKSGNNTPHDAGIKVAQLMLDRVNAAHPAMDGLTQQRLRTVVMFTDGAPSVSGVSGDVVRANTVNMAYDIKNDPDNPTKIFTISFAPANADVTFLQHVSSNYPEGKMSGSTYSGTQLPADEAIYYMNAGGELSMDKIFDFIAESVGGGGSSEYDSTPLAAVDMVSSSFHLPAGASTDRIKVYTAQCLGFTGQTITDSEQGTHDELAFAEPVLAKTRGNVSYYASTPVLDDEGKPVLDELENPKYVWELVTKDIDDGITVDIDESTQTVTVKGFDFEALWCGYDPEHANPEYYTSSDPNYDYHHDGYRGFKIIIEIPIVVNDGALGGPNVFTNLTSSGVYQTDPDTGERTGLPIVKYPVPDLPIPINLHIEKRGLKPGESATFTILKKLVEPTETVPTPEYEYFTRINVIGAEDGSPVIAKLLNLDPTYYYKIFEEGWAWTYSNQAQDIDSAPSTETITTNPIVITNTYDDPDAKHAEASKRNVMEKTTSSTTP